MCGAAWRCTASAAPPLFLWRIFDVVKPLLAAGYSFWAIHFSKVGGVTLSRNIVRQCRPPRHGAVRARSLLAVLLHRRLQRQHSRTGRPRHSQSRATSTEPKLPACCSFYAAAACNAPTLPPPKLNLADSCAHAVPQSGISHLDTHTQTPTRRCCGGVASFVCVCVHFSFNCIIN